MKKRRASSGLVNFETNRTVAKRFIQLCLQFFCFKRAGGRIVSS
jgi:hypothetical protein